MKLIIILILFLFSSLSYSQNDRNDGDYSYKHLDAKEGYDVYDVSSMVFDDLGWLWIAGTNLSANNTLFNYKPIIQRFDGQSFYTLELPNVEMGIHPEINLVKRQDGWLYVRYKSNNKVTLFIVNPTDLQFNEVVLPMPIDYQDIFLAPYKDYSLAYLTNGVASRVYQLNNTTLEFKELPNKPVTKADINETPYYTAFIPFEDHFLLQDERNGIHRYNLDGSVDEIINFESIGRENKDSGALLHIQAWFKKNDNIYVLFNGINGYYVYEPILNTWAKADVFSAALPQTNSFTRFENVHTDGLDNYVQHKMTQDSQVITIFLRDSTLVNLAIPGVIPSKIASRDYSKELFIEYNGALRHYTFENENITAFLKNKSVRALFELNKNEILVNTLYSGWYIINLNTKIERSFELLLKGKPYLVGGARGLYEDENNYWSNDSNGIIKIDKKTKEVTPFVYFPIADMVADDRYIYYATDRQNLMKFDMIDEENIIITSTHDYSCQGILKINNAIYLSTTVGLLVYENNKLEHFQPSAVADDSYLISIADHKKHGLLLGSRSGKLYQFDPDKKIFNLLYEDELQASIATMLFDDAERIWMNTFNGVVAFNPITKETSRYTMTDGLSYHESNRFSALKMENGHFLVGTLKGLNYFDPEVIAKKPFDPKLVLTSLTYFDDKTSKEVRQIAPHELMALKKITLPAEHKSVFIKFGLLGIYDSDMIKYRYRLNKQPWVDLLRANEINLFSLSSRRYTLEIEATDLANNLSSNSISLSIIVDPFFYQTTWFFIFIILFMMALALWYVIAQRKKFKLKEQFSKQIINSQEKERTRVAQELHDGVGQQLMLLTRRSKNYADPMLETLARDTLANVRRISQGLHPVVLERLGFTVAVKDLVDALEENSGLFFTSEITNIDNFLGKEQALHLFRIIQETLSNTIKHAEAKAVSITISKKANTIMICIEDNGKGFNYAKKIATSKSLGMKSLIERSKIINAKLSIDSQINKGTQTTIKLTL